MNVQASQRAITLPKVEHEMIMHESLTKESMYFHIMTTRALPKHPTPQDLYGFTAHTFIYLLLLHAICSGEHFKSFFEGL